MTLAFFMHIHALMHLMKKSVCN